jgi:hypothetical protein
MPVVYRLGNAAHRSEGTPPGWRSCFLEPVLRPNTFIRNPYGFKGLKLPRSYPEVGILTANDQPTCPREFCSKLRFSTAVAIAAITLRVPWGLVLPYR